MSTLLSVRHPAAAISFLLPHPFPRRDVVVGGRDAGTCRPSGSQRRNLTLAHVLLPFLRSCSSPAATTCRAATYVLPHCRAETRASTSSTCTSDSGLTLDNACRASSERSLEVSQGFQAGVPCGFADPSSVKRPVLSRSPRESPSAPLLLTVAATSRHPQQRAGVCLPTLFPHRAPMPLIELAAESATQACRRSTLPHGQQTLGPAMLGRR
jgi:hypothetical protein